MSKTQYDDLDSWLALGALENCKPGVLDNIVDHVDDGRLEPLTILKHVRDKHVKIRFDHLYGLQRILVSCRGTEAKWRAVLKLASDDGIVYEDTDVGDTFRQIIRSHLISSLGNFVTRERT